MPLYSAFIIIILAVFILEFEEVQELEVNLVCFMIRDNPLNYRGSCDIKRAFQNFKDTHTDWNFIWIARLL